MSSAERQQASGLNVETLLIGLVVAVTIGAFLFLSGQSQQTLRASPSGFDGLQIWLTSEDQSVQNFTGGWTIDKDNVGLLVLPLFDRALDLDRVVPVTKEDLLFQQDENDQQSRHLLTKADMVPTLVILPKWRSGLRLTGLGHPALLVENAGVEKALQVLTGSPSERLTHIPYPFTEFDYRTLDGTTLAARLYVAQVFHGQGCEPIIGRIGEMVLGECPLAGGEETVLILSDPDLLNNHGLRLGENAYIAQDFFTRQAGASHILIDYSSSVWLTDSSDNVVREKTWTDMLRFFEPPFLALWMSGAFITMLVLWRSGLRYGPVLAVKSKLGASKIPAIRARARLLRLTDQDGILLSAYATARMSATATGLFGPTHTRHRQDEDAVLRYLHNKNPALEQKLAALLVQIRDLPHQLAAADAIAYVDELEDLLENVFDDT